jgi:DNA/RNA endonuclease YhcR with UshA esterase domain
MHSFQSARFVAFLAACALLPPLACFAQTAPIPDAQAAAHVGQHVTIEGTVASVHTSRKGHTYINFGAPYPAQDFTAVVFASSAGAFINLAGLSGKHVQVTGVIRLYEGKPEVILEAPAQLKVLER